MIGLQISHKFTEKWGEKTPTTKKCPKKKHNEQNSNETKHINIKRPQNEENERKQSKMHMFEE